MATQSRHVDWVPLESVGARWFAISVLALVPVVAAYLLAHGHPAYEGGLYLEIVRQIQTHGYALPNRIPGYTVGGVPLAYPPLQFYVLAAIVDVTGADPVWLEGVLPAVGIVTYLFAYHRLARELLADDRAAGLATVIFGVAPPVLRWHLSAGGVVRAPAMALTVAGLYVGVRLFRDGGRRWLAAATILWALVLVSHPVYTAFFGLSYLVLYAAFDRSWLGLVAGGTVAVGGVLLTAPWWVTVARRHGLDVFLGATNSRSHFAGGIGRLATQFVWPMVPFDAISPFYVLAFAGGLYALSRRRWLLVGWLFVASYGLGKQRLVFVPGAMLASVFVFEWIVPRAERLADRVDRRAVASLVVLVVVIVGSTGVGVAFAGSALHTAETGSPTMPQTVDPPDRATMRWAKTHTAPDATFLVLGDAAEWFPYYSDRTIVVSPWGTEWTDHFHRSVDRYLTLSTCHSSSCLEASPSSSRPDYLVVPNRAYTVRGTVYDRPDDLIDDLTRSPRYTVEFQNAGRIVFAVHDEPPSSTGPTRSAVGPRDESWGVDPSPAPESPGSRLVG